MCVFSIKIEVEVEVELETQIENIKKRMSSIIFEMYCQRHSELDSESHPDEK